MIKVTNIVKFFTHPDDPGNDDSIDVVIENLARDSSMCWARVTVGGAEYQVDVRDLMDACRNIQNGGTR